MNKHRLNTKGTLARMGVSGYHISSLLRASATLHSWAEHECNGAIQRDEATNKPSWYNTRTGKRICATSDREAGALKRVHAIAACYGLTAYHQTDPRGCALYLLRAGDVPDGADVSAYYSRGIAVVTG